MFTNDVICSLTWRQMTEIEVEWLIWYENFNLERRSFRFNISSKALTSVRTNVNNKFVMVSCYIFYKWLALSLNKICKLVSSIDVVNCGGYGIITHYLKLCSDFFYICGIRHGTRYGTCVFLVSLQEAQNYEVHEPSPSMRTADFCTPIYVLFPALVYEIKTTPPHWKMYFFKNTICQVSLCFSEIL